MNEYKHKSEVLNFIYDKNYASIYRIGLRKSNYVALPGKAHQRYTNYMKKITGAPDNWALFIDIDLENFHNLEDFKKNNTGIYKHLKKMTPKLKNIFHYDTGMQKTARVEDIGIGEHNVNTLMPYIIQRLFRQSIRTKKYLWKAQILDMSKRSVSDDSLFTCLRYYFRILGAELKSVDGLDYNKRIKRNKIFSRGESIYRYYDDSGKYGNVYDHFLKFEPYGRIEYTKVYTYYNGGPMVNVLVIYK